MRFQFIFSVSSALLILSLFNGCNNVPVYPDAPQIEFKDIYPAGLIGDTAVVTFRFKDGDGDLGLRSEDISYPYQKFDVQKDINGNIKKYNGIPLYNCNDYDIGLYDGDLIMDTVLIVKNPNTNNYFIDFLVKQTDNSYLPYDFSAFCFSFNGRFPLLGSLDHKGPIEGTLSYTLKDLQTFSGQTLKFRIYILDRALHKSNVIETSEIKIN